MNWPELKSEHRPWTRWWWLGSAVSEAEITRHLELFHAAGFGGVVAFELAEGDSAMVHRFLDALELVLPVTTLGGVASQILYPALSSHRALEPERRRALGIGDGLLRLSAGIEEAGPEAALLRGGARNP